MPPTRIPLLFGISWMDPDWLLDRFGTELFWISLVIVFIECGLFFPFLPGDTLLFALGLFIAAGQPRPASRGGTQVELAAGHLRCCSSRRSWATRWATRSAG